MFLRRIVFQMHLWIGVLAGLYIFVVCVTGAALVFRIDMQRAVHPHLFTPGTPGPLVDAVTVMESVRDAYPPDRVSGVDAPTTARPTYLAYVISGERFLTVLLDPVTAKVLGELPERSIVRVVQDLHFDLLAGPTGRVINGVGALCLLVMCMTGPVIWWQGAANWRRGLTVNFSRSWKRLNWDLHSAVGIWSVVLIALWAVTGIYFVFPSPLRATVNWLSPISVSRPPISDPSGRAAATRPTWRELVERSRQRAPGQHVARVVVPATDRGAFLVLFSEASPTPAGTANLAAVYLDQFTGELLQDPPRNERTVGDVIMAWVAPLHVGNFGGPAVKVVKMLWLIFGLTPPLLFATGCIMWWTRVVRPRWLLRSTALVLSLSATLAGYRVLAQDAWDLPPRVAAPAVPASAPMTPARIELGRRLFYDTRLSGNGTQSCGTCHIQERAFTDGRALGLGSTGMVHPRSPMSLVNVAYRDTLTWANPSLRTLEAQALVPMFGTTPIELGLKGHEARVYATLAGDAVYRPLFAAAFPGVGSPVTTANVAAALAAFERSIVSFRSPFDRYRQNEDQTALSESASRGSVLFFSSRKAACANCHRGLNLDGGSKTTDTPADEVAIFQFHNTGLYNLRGRLSYPADNTGLHAHTGKRSDVGKFRVPTLRNIAVTAPYMHDGSMATLDEVLDHYAKGGRTPNRNRSTGLSPFTLTPDDRRDLLAFLESLTDSEALRDPRWSDPWK